MQTLIIKLPSEVDDDSLKRIDEIRFEARTNLTPEGAARNVLELNPGSQVNGRITGNGHFTNAAGTQDNGKSFNVGKGATYTYTSIGDYYLFIGHKDILTKVKIDAVGLFIELSELSYCTNLKVISIIDLRGAGDLSDIINVLPGIEQLTLRGNLFTGDAGLLDETENLTELMLRNTAITGTLNIGRNIGLSSVNIIGTEVVADFDDIADNMVTNGRVSGTMEVYMPNQAHVVYTFTSEGWTKV